ncbi:asparagine synthase-related protein [Desulfoluna spongiiphila]|uniref:asparagine synthase-related protein n=1 Tax=Desulfoluna spongiiphila TaxID=419481 RepID=UPI001253AEF3|nr:asparagine synthase-related protein [Desulfoluna spongiiphila]VVS92357.1 asparagine synthase [Desulfoluna spongiiphila]
MIYKTDKWGLYPTFMLKQDNQLIFADNVDELATKANALLTVDYRAWACQFFFSCPLGDRTYFNEIKMIPPGETWQVSEQNGKTSIRVSRDELPAYCQSVKCLDEATSGVSERLINAVKKNISKTSATHFLCFLSGGWDSRALVACLNRIIEPGKLTAYTTNYDSGNDKDEKFSTLVAKALGLAHRVYPLPENYYKRYASEAFHNSDYFSDFHVWMSNFLSMLQIPTGSINYDGYGGDILIRGMNQEVGDEKLPPNSAVFFERLSTVNLSTVLTSPVYHTLMNLARQELALELSKYPSKDKILWFLLRNRGSRAISYSLREQRKYMDVALPFLDDDLFEYILRIDPSIRLREEFYPEVLKKIDSRLCEIPSTNDSLSADWKVSDIIKHSGESIDYVLERFEMVTKKISNTNCMLDWYSLTPSRIFTPKLTRVAQTRHKLGLNRLHLFAEWLSKYSNKLCLTNFFEEMLNDKFLDCHTSFNPIKRETRYNYIADYYSKKINKLEKCHSLNFNFTMDVEAFGIDDPYAVQTANEYLLEKLVYGDFGEGSIIQSLFHSNQIPCTYFIEPFLSVWKNRQDFAEAIRFFGSEYSEIGLHCHAFSLQDEIKKHLEIDCKDWFLYPAMWSKILCFGKTTIERELKRSINAFRTGRLDIYPEMGMALKEAGFTIDSSYADRVPAYAYAQGFCTGNNAISNESITHIPITCYSVQERKKLLDFNSSSFDEICFSVFKALELGIPSVAMLLHSWSFNCTEQHNTLYKVIHSGTSKELVNKFYHIVDFINNSKNINITTVSDNKVVQRLSTQSFSKVEDVFELYPPPLKVEAYLEANTIWVHCIPNRDKFNGQLEYAYYLLFDDVRVETIWYTRKDTMCFQTQPQSGKIIEVIGFVREIDVPAKMFNRRVSIITSKLSLIE